MRQAIAWHAAGDWPQTAQAGTVTLRYADRSRRRGQMTADSGQAVLLNLPRPVRLSDGDGLRLAEGGFIRVIAAAEVLLEVTAEDAQTLARLAWHIGNRHIPAEILDDRHLRIVFDPVLEIMLRQLGAMVHALEAPFHPEGGAYAAVGITGHAH
jgi:urease accessory protein